MGQPHSPGAQKWRRAPALWNAPSCAALKEGPAQRGDAGGLAPGPPREITPLYADQAGKLLKTSKGHDLEQLFALILGTGVCLGEPLALRSKDVDRAECRIRIRQALEQLPGRP